MKKLFICLAISFGLTCILTFFSDNSLYQFIELKLYDLRMVLRTPPKQDDSILFVEMDEDAIEEMGRWPWPRDVIADIINTLVNLDAKQVLFDITFAQPTQLIVKKGEIGHIFEGKKQIHDYIVNEIGIIKSKETVPQEDAAWTLDQIRSSFNEYTNATEQKLMFAIKDR